MRTLTAPATLVTGRTYTEPVLLVTMTTTSGTTFKLSDYDRVIGGVEYSGLIQNPEDLTEALNDFDGGGTPATAQLVLFNARPVSGKARFSDLIQTPRNLSGTYDFSNARVDIDRLESGQALADAVRLQSFYLEAPSAIGDSLITLQMSDLSLKLEDALPVTKITRSAFPSAGPDVIEQEIRRPFGTLKNVKALPIVDGAATEVAADMAGSGVAPIDVVDASLLPFSGTALVEEEFVRWTAKSGNTLSGVTRGANSTLVAAHTAGTRFMHTRTDEYVFVIGEGALSGLEAGADLIVNGDFNTDLAGWTNDGPTAATWDSGSGGQCSLSHPPAGAAQVSQTPTITPGIPYRVRYTTRGSFAPTVSVISNSINLSTTATIGSFDVTVTPTGSTMQIQAVAHALGTGFVDAVSVVPLLKVFPITSISNVRVNGQLARTSPTLTPADTTRLANHVLGIIKFTVADVVNFHILPLGQPEVIAPGGHTLSVIGDGATNVADSTVVTPTVGEAEVPKRTRRTISWSIATTEAFVAANFWHLGRYLTAKGIGTLLVVGVGQGTAGNLVGDTWSGSHTIEYESDGSETIVFTSLIGSAKVITCTFTEITVTYESGGGGGNSTAGVVVGDVTCDLVGIQDDAGGTLTGTAATPLELPTDVAAFILRYLYEVPVADFDTSWSTTRAVHQTLAAKWAFLLGAYEFSRLRRAISEQARARLILASGKVGLRFLPYRPTAGLTFQYDPVGGRTGVAQDVAVRITSPTEMVAGFTVRYGFDDAKGDYLNSLVMGDTVLAGSTPPMELPFVADEATARDIGAYWYGLRRRQRFAVDATAWHNALALEQGDHFALQGHPVLGAHGDQALIFSLQRKTDRGGRDGIGKIAIGGLEDTIEGDVGPEDTSMAWGSRGLLAKNNAATPNTKIDVTAASVVLRNTSNLIVIRHNPGSLTLDATQAGPVANGRDQAGAHTASSWVHVYWIWDAVNAVLALLSSATAPPTGPTLPSGFTYWGYVGAVYFNASSQFVRTTISGSWASRTNVEALAAAVTVNTEQSYDGTAVWPPNAMRIGGSWVVVLNVAGDSADLRPETGVDSGPHLEAAGASTTGTGGGFRCNVTGQTLWYIQSANASRVWRLEINEYCLPNGGEG